MNQPQLLSNAFDDFVAGGQLYPGGSGIITEFHYRLWDYEGKVAPDSVCAVHMVIQPNDGSNEGKPVEVFWSVGPSSDFQPDHTGGFLLSSTRAGISDGSNWGDISARFKNTCGLDGTMLNTPGVGIRAMIGGEITVTRVDQVKRDNLDAPEPGKKEQKRTILVPTRFKGPWEKGGRPAARPVTQMQAPNPVAAPAYVPPVAAAPMNGAFDIGSALRAIIDESGGAVMATDLPRAMLNKLVSVTPTDRLSVMTSIKPENLINLAPTLGLKFDGAILNA